MDLSWISYSLCVGGGLANDDDDDDDDDDDGWECRVLG